MTQVARTQAARDGAAPAGNRHSVWLILALIVWIAALRWPFFLYEPTGPDEGLYLAAAVRMLAGARLYTDVWDNKPVGIYLVYAAIAATLGSSRAALNLASALAVLASAWLLYLIGRDATGRKQPGIIAAFMLPAYMLDLGVCADPEPTLCGLCRRAAIFTVRPGRWRHSHPGQTAAWMGPDWRSRCVVRVSTDVCRSVLHQEWPVTVADWYQFFAGAIG